MATRPATRFAKRSVLSKAGPARKVVPAFMDEPACESCGKPASLCVCDSITPIENRVELLVLQHPQEQDKTLGTARVAALQLSRSTFKIGLSWPSLSAALGREADPKRWAILHLGASQPEDSPAGAEITVLDRHGKPMEDQKRGLADIEGIVVFDGTWSQAKAMWWRNAWVLKGKRLALRPSQPSLYGKLRKEPRREGLSTIEAAGFVISRLERRPEIEKTLQSTFRRMLQRYRSAMDGSGAKPADSA
jgi:DTW domain-containing protein YfiP